MCMAMYAYTMQQYIMLLLLVASLLHITTSTVYYVMPGNHYPPISDNTHTLQHYLNNTSKYFTSNTRLHFLPGQYYLNNDFIIQGVSNFSLIGNRTNEIINTVINCTLPAGVAVVDSSNIVIANIVMNECGNDYRSFTNDIFQYHGDGKESLLALNISKSITITHFYSLCHQKLCGLELVNALESKLSNVVSTYLLLWYIGNTTTTNATDTLLIENFQICCTFYNIYAIKIEWNNITFDFQATILNVNFNNNLALDVTCRDCLGHNMITINNCSFSDTDTDVDITVYDYNFNGSFEDYYYYYFNDVKYACKYENGCINKIGVYYHFTNAEIEVDQATNRLVFSNCQFINNRKDATTLRIVVENTFNKEHGYVQSVAIQNCLFYNNNDTQILSVECYNKGGSSKYCVSVLIDNTTISSNVKFFGELIHTYYVLLTFESVTVINNTIISHYPVHIDIIQSVIMKSTIIEAMNSYVEYNKYNEIAENSEDILIDALTIHINENSVLNISFNVLQFIIFSRQKVHYEICAIQ